MPLDFTLSEERRCALDRNGARPAFVYVTMSRATGDDVTGLLVRRRVADRGEGWAKHGGFLSLTVFGFEVQGKTLAATTRQAQAACLRKSNPLVSGRRRRQFYPWLGGSAAAGLPLVRTWGRSPSRLAQCWKDRKNGRFWLGRNFALRVRRPIFARWNGTFWLTTVSAKIAESR